MRYEEFLKETAAEFADNSIIEADDFPDLELNADQVSEFLSAKLSVYGKDPLISKSKINAFVKKGLLPKTENKRFNREQVILTEILLLLSTAYRESDVEAVMKPIIENIESTLDEQNDYFALYSNLVSVYKRQRHEIAERTINSVDIVKSAMRETESDDDDTLELFLVLLSIAMEVDTAMYLGKKLLREYFSDKPKAADR